MQRLSGVLMVLAGTALGGYMVLPAPQNGAENLAEVTRISAAPDRDTPAVIVGPAKADTAPRADGSGVRVFSQNAPLAPADPTITAAAPASASTWTAVVTSEPTTTGKLTSSKPGDAETRAHLASDLQRELKRVGCYGGEISGAWTQSSKRAMSAFMERVNATLPVEEPDYILLTLVQGHTAMACGIECPAGQVESGVGSCTPQAVVAQASRKLQREDDRRAVEARKTQQQEHLAHEQRLTEAKRIADAQRRAEAAASAKLANAAKKAAKPQQTAAVAPEQLPWLVEDQVSAAGTAAAAPSEIAAQVPAVKRAAPLEGMMSVGGPRTLKAELPANVAVGAPDRGPRPELSLERNRDLRRDAVDADTLADTVVIPPAPRRAVRPSTQPRQPSPIRQAAIQDDTYQGTVVVPGLKGTKSGAAARQSAITSVSPSPVIRKYRPAKIVRRPSPIIVYAPKPKPYYYASNSTGKVRRGQPRRGTMQYNLLQSLGGIY